MVEIFTSCSRHIFYNQFNFNNDFEKQHPIGVEWYFCRWCYTLLWVFNCLYKLFDDSKRMSIEIENNLKVWRAKFNLTQAELADLVEVTRKTTNTLERGIYTPSVSLALKIAKVFDTQVEQIFFLNKKYIFQRKPYHL